MGTAQWHFEPLSPETHAETRQLILDGLEEHWGKLDDSLNPDLHDMLTSHRAGLTIVALAADGSNDRVIGTGTVLPRDGARSEIVRMSVASDQRRTGLGRAIVAHLESVATNSGSTRMILETSSAWTDVVAFYLSCGYRITHTEDSDFGEDTWFEKKLAK